MTAHANPKIIHYAGPDKPWNDPNTDYAGLFWKYARESKYYESIIYRNTQKEVKIGVKGQIKNIARKALPENTKMGQVVRKIIGRTR